MNKRILHLTLKEEWFDLIALGRKTMEYRERKEYWLKRFIEGISSTMGLIPKEFDEIYFRNGYTKDRPFMRVEWKGLVLIPYERKMQFGIILGEVLEIRNWNKKEKQKI